ncbi:HTH_Tnp_Tc3_2 domain-containing protein [Trichonephila clavipes]|nr:HTH_Tnp_Tc3_2 domain-containing protein [Trichonephila clavipes]
MNGLYARVPRVCVSLSVQARGARLKWCREHANWTVSDWGNVMFTMSQDLLWSQLNNGASRTVRIRTVQRSLHRMCFGNRRPPRVLLFNARHRAARLAWAKQYTDWSVEEWSSME